MSGKASEELARKLRSLAKEAAGGGTFYAEVVSVDESLRSCEVKVEDVFYEDVALYAVENTDLKGPCIIPKKGSRVLVDRIDGSNLLYVSMFSEIDKLIITLENNTTFQVSAAGFKLVRGTSGLLKTLTDLCTAIEKLTVDTAMGPSSIPLNVADFVKIKTDLKNYLEG